MEFLTEEVIREVSIFRTHSQSISHALSLQKRENETGTSGKVASACCSEISIVFFQTAPTRFEFLLLFFTYFPLPSLSLSIQLSSLPVSSQHVSHSLFALYLPPSASHSDESTVRTIVPFLDVHVISTKKAIC